MFPTPTTPCPHKSLAPTLALPAVSLSPCGYFLCCLGCLLGAAGFLVVQPVMVILVVCVRSAPFCAVMVVGARSGAVTVFLTFVRVCTRCPCTRRVTSFVTSVVVVRVQRL